MKLEFWFVIMATPVIIALVVIMRADLILQYFSDRKKNDSILDTDDDTPTPAANEDDADAPSDTTK